MEMTTADASKRSRPKASAAAAPKSASKRATRVQADVTEMIATTAYFLAAERDFVPGHELDDWLEAERRVQALSNG